MKPLRLFVTVRPIAEAASLAAFLWLGMPQQINNRAHFAAENSALQANADSQNILPGELLRRAGECPAPLYETDLFGMKRTLPDLGGQLECQQRILYGDFYDPAYSWQFILHWLELPFWMLLTALATLTATYGLVFGVRFAGDKWWPWIKGD
jgi:hypothetical protein